ncbi:hypothetical protein N0M98_27015 [Paenibacillus doosanensis]|uniref:Uncharacterized protein n=1 Tax=Paenibacillus konkukensis TaxID=2020716 RepID=A0ABY4RUE3_9BACL|nr:MULTISPECIES: hypothetical protein [Paenibacillus]MCS7463760.1 hypothetical protein [Paenibacillus doosanensis]UQZ85256.1 hypothetical protein SK3146_04545 [Paenibacillus konkukensis]
MYELSSFAYRHWLSLVLILGVIVAVALVYKHWDKIVIKGSGRK